MKQLHKLKNLVLVTSCILTFLTAAGQQQRTWGDWMQWGDTGNGTYLNPVIPSDYSDIDCIRVGDAYYAISSTFQFSPGMTILYSRDLVNWAICGNAVSDLTQISDQLNWNHMNRYGKGIWAGTLRYHNNRFYLFFGTPDEGYFMTSAPNPEGPWQPLTCLLAEKGWDDCAVMWDVDGSACFVGTHFADGYKTYLFNLSPDGKKIDRKSAQLINDGNHREANKLIFAQGYYYLIFSEHKDGVGRYVMAKRSKRMRGPYLEEKQLALPSTAAFEPNQGGIIPGKDGNWYFLTHHGTGDWSGRAVSLLPVTWINGWPIIGRVLESSIGTMQWSGRMMVDEGQKLSIARSDDFKQPELAPQWQWNYQPRKDMFSLSARKGWLRLHAFRPLKNDTLLSAGNTLTQRSFRIPQNEVTIKMDITHMANGQKNGLCHFSSQSAALGVAKESDSCFIEFRKNDRIQKGHRFSSATIWLRSVWGLNGLSQFYYSLDGNDFVPFGEPYQLVWGNYRGDRLGIYCFNNTGENGSVDIDYFHYH